MGLWSLYSEVPFPIWGCGVYTPQYHSLYGIVEFILRSIIPCIGLWSLYSAVPFHVWGCGVYTPQYHSLYRVVEFILRSTIPCMGLWSLYSTVPFPVWGCGVCSLVNRESLLQLRSELRSDVLLVTPLSGMRTHNSLHVCKSCLLTTEPRSPPSCIQWLVSPMTCSQLQQSYKVRYLLFHQLCPSMEHH